MTFDLSPYERKQTFKENCLLDVFGYEKSVITSTQNYQLQEKDELSFMGTFTFPKIEDFKKSLAKTGKYTIKQISEIVEGLEDFPEYQK